jgi:hypothetical protein
MILLTGSLELIIIIIIIIIDKTRISDKLVSISVVARSKAWVYGGSLAGIAGSNPAGGINVSLLRMLCVVRQRSLRRTDHSSRGVLPSACVSECDCEAWTMRRPLPNRGCCTTGGKTIDLKRTLVILSRECPGTLRFSLYSFILQSKFQ